VRNDDPRSFFVDKRKERGFTISKTKRFDNPVNNGYDIDSIKHSKKSVTKDNIQI
jgi:hypothetical protein